MPRSFAHEAEYAHPVDQIWRALTEPHLMGLWIMNFDNSEGEMKTDFRPVAGAPFRMDARTGRGWRGFVVGRVLEVAPQERLVLSWAHSSYQDANPARIEFALAPTAKGTRLRMEQSDFPGFKGWFVMMGAKLGWKMMLDKALPAMLEGKTKKEGAAAPDEATTP